MVVVVVGGDLQEDTRLCGEGGHFVCVEHLHFFDVLLPALLPLPLFPVSSR